MDETTQKIKQFIVDEFMPDVPVDELDSDFDLLTGGVVDSLGLLQVVAGSRPSSTSPSTTPSWGPRASARSTRSSSSWSPPAGRRMPARTPTGVLDALVTQSYPIPEEVWGEFWDRLSARELVPGEGLAVVAALTTRIPDGATVSALLASLRARNPQPDPPTQPTVNIVGTGGGPSTFNLSTASGVVGATHVPQRPQLRNAPQAPRLLASGEEIDAEVVGGGVGYVGERDDGCAVGTVDAEVRGVAAGLTAVPSDRLAVLPCRGVPEAADASVRL